MIWLVEFYVGGALWDHLTCDNKKMKYNYVDGLLYDEA